MTVICPCCKSEKRNVLPYSIHDSHDDIKEIICSKCEEQIKKKEDAKHSWIAVPKIKYTERVVYYYEYNYCKGEKSITHYYDGRKSELWINADTTCAEDRLENILA